MEAIKAMEPGAHLPGNAGAERGEAIRVVAAREQLPASFWQEYEGVLARHRIPPKAVPWYVRWAQQFVFRRSLA